MPQKSLPKSVIRRFSSPLLSWTLQADLKGAHGALELEQRGYQMCLLHPGQIHHFHQQRGLRAKTDRLDAMTIARAVLSGEAQVGYIPGEQVAAYRELVRFQAQFSEEAARYKNQIQALVVVLFPEFKQVFADPCGQTALAVLTAYPHAQELAEVGPEAVHQVQPTSSSECFSM